MATIDTARSNKIEDRTTVLSASAQKWHTHHTNHMNSGGFKLSMLENVKGLKYLVSS